VYFNQYSIQPVQYDGRSSDTQEWRALTVGSEMGLGNRSRLNHPIDRTACSFHPS
jgi:hypothetical protein